MENHDKCIKKCVIVNPGNNYQLESSISGYIVGLYCNSPWQTVIIQEFQGNIYNPILPSTHPWDNPCCDEWKHGTPWTGCKCITGLSNRGEWFRTLTFTSMWISLESAVDLMFMSLACGRKSSARRYKEHVQTAHGKALNPKPCFCQITALTTNLTAVTGWAAECATVCSHSTVMSVCTDHSLSTHHCSKMRNSSARR